MAARTPSDTLHIVKLSVGTDTVEDLGLWQANRSSRRKALGLDPCPRHVTRVWPRRAAELLSGGSLYWVIRGVIAVRQRIVDLEEVVGDDGIRRCGIVLDPELVRTEPRSRRPFQGWRYLTGPDAPPDLTGLGSSEECLPPELGLALRDLGVLPA